MGVIERREREREEVRRKILDAARDLFTPEGYERVTMRRIADAIEYSPTTIYNHFEDKDDLVKALCHEDFARSFGHLRQPRAGGSRGVRSVSSAIAYARFGLAHPNHYRFMFMTPGKFEHRRIATSPGERVLRAPAHRGRGRPSRRASSVHGDVDTMAQVLWASMHGAVALLITLHPEIAGRTRRPGPTSSSRSWTPASAASCRSLPPRGTEMVSLARKNLLHDRLRFAHHRLRRGLRGDAGPRPGRSLHGPAGQGHRHHRARERRHLGHLARARPTSTSRTPSPRPRSCACAAFRGVERADNLIVQFMNIQLPNGAEEGCLVYALADFAGLEPALERGGRGRRGPQARPLHPHGPLRGAALRRLRRRRLPRDPRPPLQDHRHHHRGRVLHHRAHRLHGLRQRAGAARRSCRARRATSWSRSPRARTCRRWRRRSAGVAPYNDVHTRAEWAARRASYWVVSTGLGMNMGVTVFLGILVGIVVVAQTLYTSAVEHVKEFGTVKAIGGSNWDIYRILGEQALIAAVVGFGLGGVISYAMRPADGEAAPERPRLARLRGWPSSWARCSCAWARRCSRSGGWPASIPRWCSAA